jgi:hypothetical protein
VVFKRVTSLDFKFKGKFTIVKLAVIAEQDLLNLTKLIDLASLSADSAVSISLFNLIDLAAILLFNWQGFIMCLLNLTKFS